MICQARAMAAVALGDSVPECDETAEQEVSGYQLCSGCATALEIFAELGMSLLPRLQRCENVARGRSSGQVGPAAQDAGASLGRVPPSSTLSGGHAAEASCLAERR